MVFSSLLCSALAASARAAIPQDLTTTIIPLGHLALGLNQATGIYSRDNSRLAFPGYAGDLSATDHANLESDGKVRGVELHPIRIYVDNTASVATTEVTGPVFSDNSQHVGYALKVQGKWRVIVDGQAVVADADGVANTPVIFSPDSQHTATLVQRDFRWVLSVDGKAWPTISDPQVDLPSFSPDSKHVVAVGHTKNTAIIYLDGVPLTSLFDAARPLERVFPSYNWRPDSGVIGFYGAFPDKHWQVFTTEVPPFESPPHDGILRGCPVFSKDSRRFAYGVQAHGKWTIIIHEDPTPSPQFDEVAAGSLVFLVPGPMEKTPKPHLLYLARQGKLWRMYLDQRAISDPFDQLVDGTYVISPDQQHFALAVRRPAPGGGVQTLLLHDGKALALAGALGKNTLAFSPDSQHIAFTIQVKERWCVAMDGVRGEADFSAIAETSPSFSPDSRTVAYNAALNPGAWRLYVGVNADFQSKPFDSFLPNVGITWRGPDQLITIAVIKKVAQRVEAALPR